MQFTMIQTFDQLFNRSRLITGGLITTLDFEWFLLHRRDRLMIAVVHYRYFEPN
jgi:hypothetical protein